tara:strand:- start:338 stop:577 length:240 start_codon:yes stop_codon:yes gene_type:complete
LDQTGCSFGYYDVEKVCQYIGSFSHRSVGLLDYQLSTGPLEGTNNMIKTMKRQAYGFRDMEFFKLKIMAIHEAKYALVG